MKSKYYKYNLTFLMLLFLANAINAQWSFKIGTEQSYSDNPFNSPIAFSSLISSIDFGIEKNINSFGLGYYGSYTSFENLSDRNFYWHQVGLWSLTDSSMYGFYIEQRLNTIEYDFYNYTNYNAYHKYLFQFSDFTIFTNLAVNLTDYSSLEDLDNILGKAGFSINKSFETRTTLIGGVDFNYKNHFSTNLNDDNLVGDSLSSSTTHSYNSQLKLYVRISQSVAEKTGLALQFTNQTILGGTSNYIRNLEYIYGDESQYFDDPTSYEEYNISLQLTQILPEEITFRSNYSFGKKEYPSHGIYLDAESFDQEQLRKDEQNQFSISLSKNINLGSEDQNSILVSLFYKWINNSSNSYWYTYKSAQIDLSIAYHF